MHHNATHGMRNTAEYRAWSAMKSRCNSPTNKVFNSYGGRGITYCERWEQFENFIEDMGMKPSSELTLERIDNDGNYTPQNCKWATSKEQNRNRRNTIVLEIGESRCQISLTEFAEETGLDYNMLIDYFLRRKTRPISPPRIEYIQRMIGGLNASPV